MGHGTEEHSHEQPGRTLINHGLQLVSTGTSLFVGKCVSDADWVFITDAYEVSDFNDTSEALKPETVGSIDKLGLVKVPMNSVHFMVQLNPADWTKYIKD